jgi:hypothetical protein
MKTKHTPGPDQNEIKNKHKANLIAAAINQELLGALVSVLNDLRESDKVLSSVKNAYIVVAKATGG